MEHLGKAKYLLKSESTFIEGMGEWFHILDSGGAELAQVPMNPDQARMAMDRMNVEPISPTQYLDLITSGSET